MKQYAAKVEPFFFYFIVFWHYLNEVKILFTHKHGPNHWKEYLFLESSLDSIWAHRSNFHKSHKNNDFEKYKK